MNSIHGEISIRVLGVVLPLFVLYSLTPARQPDFDALTVQFSTQIKAAKVKTVTVADFAAPDGTVSTQGKYLAGYFSASLDRHRERFEVIDRGQLSRAVAAQHFSEKDAASAEGIMGVAKALDLDAVITGTLQTAPDQITLKVSLWKLSSGTVIASGISNIPHAVLLDSLDPKSYGENVAKARPAGINGIGVPVCIVCPAPEYSDEARMAKIPSATVILAVVVTEEGRAAALTVIQDPGYCLAEKTIESISEWRFKPAEDKEGKPVAVRVPIEATFRIFQGPGHRN